MGLHGGVGATFTADGARTGAATGGPAADIRATMRDFRHVGQERRPPVVDPNADR